MTTEVVLRKSWDLAVKHWQFLALVTLISFGISLVLGLVVGGSLVGGLGGLIGGANTDQVALDTLFTGAGLASLGLGAIVTVLVMPWLTGASAHAGKMTLAGVTGNAWAPFQAALGQYLTFLLLSIVLGVVLGIGFMLFIIPGIILAVLLGLSPVIVAYENVGVGTALKKAWDLGMKHFWTILLVGIIVGAASFVLSLVLGWIPLVGAYISMLVATFGAVAMAVIYTETK